MLIMESLQQANNNMSNPSRVWTKMANNRCMILRCQPKAVSNKTLPTLKCNRRNSQWLLNRWVHVLSDTTTFTILALIKELFRATNTLTKEMPSNKWQARLRQFKIRWTKLSLIKRLANALLNIKVRSPVPKSMIWNNSNLKKMFVHTTHYTKIPLCYQHTTNSSGMANVQMLWQRLL